MQTITQFQRLVRPLCSSLLLLVSPPLLAQDNDPRAMVQAFADKLEEFRALEAEGLAILEAQRSSREGINRIKSEYQSALDASEALNREKETYRSAADRYNRVCVNGNPTGAAAERCQRQGQELNATAADLQQRTDAIKPQIDQYNAAVERFNSEDSASTSQSDANLAEYQAMEREINAMKQDFVNYANASANAALRENMINCMDLTRFEDSLTCLREVVDLGYR